jgi:IS30 family transposase
MSKEERISIESDLNTPGVMLKTAAAHIDRDPKTVRVEVKKHSIIRIRCNQRNKCGLQKVCTKVRLCPDCMTGHCKECHHDSCNQICPDYTDRPVCDRLRRWPYVCNSCSSLSICRLPKLFYYADKAQIEHSHSVSDWKTGPQIPEKDMAIIYKAFQRNVSKGHSVTVIIAKNSLSISPSTAYRYISSHFIPGVLNMNLKRKIRYTPRSSSKPILLPKNHDWLNGRKFTDYQARIEDSPDINVWQMDTVIGHHGSDEKCILTLLYTKTNLQLYFLLNSCTAANVIKIFDAIKGVLGSELFKETFPVILTDNGTEFSNPILIETDPQTGEQLIHVYYCDPRRSEQKGKCEKNHEHLREIIPQGYSMNTLSKHDINRASNMVNNYPRKSLQYRSPYEASLLFLNEKVLGLNRLTHLANEEVNLIPILH